MTAVNSTATSCCSSSRHNLLNKNTDRNSPVRVFYLLKVSITFDEVEYFMWRSHISHGEAVFHMSLQAHISFNP